MQSATFNTILTVFSLFLRLCHGAPPRETSKVTRTPYSRTEELFIINEMRRYPGKWLPIWGQDMWTEILKEHCKMHESDPSTFPSRTVYGLSLHFQKKMLRSKGKVPLPGDVLARIPKSRKEKRGDDSGPTDYLQNAREGLELRESFKMKTKYTPEEDKFIINFIKNYPIKPTPVFGIKLWTEAAEQLNDLRKSNPTDFPQERLGSALRDRFRRLSQTVVNKKESNLGKVSDPERNMVYRYTPEEDKFIIEELLKPNSTSIYSLSAWAKIKARHDLKVESKTPGFDRYRSILSLKMHSNTMLMDKKNQLPPALTKKFSSNFSKSEGDTSREFHSSGETAHTQGASNEPDVAFWDEMIEELLNAPVDIDFRFEDQ